MSAATSRELGVAIYPYFCNYRNMPTGSSRKNAEQVARYADMFSAIGTEPRLRIMQLLLSAHPDGLTPGRFKRNWTFRIPRFPTIWISSGPKIWSRCAAKARSCATQPTPKPCRSCYSFCTRNAAHGIKP